MRIGAVPVIVQMMAHNIWEGNYGKGGIRGLGVVIVV
jgi:hypothetical protein